MNIINALPGIIPSVRSCTMGEWPQKRMKMRNGRTQRWGLSNRPAGDAMELAWENITYAQAEQLVSIWDLNYGIYGILLIPPEILAGTSGGLNALLATPFVGATWHFTGPPQVNSVKARRCTARIPIGVRNYTADGEAARAVSSGGYYAQTQWVSDNCPINGLSISVKYNYIDYRGVATACANPSSVRTPNIAQEQIITRDPRADNSYRVCGVRIFEKYRYEWTETCSAGSYVTRQAGVQWLWEGDTWTAFASSGGYGEAIQGQLPSLWENSSVEDPNYQLYDILEIKIDGQLLLPSEMIPYTP